MVYPEYEKTKTKFYDLQRRFAQLMMDKERIYTNTLPSGIRYDKDIIQTSPTIPLENYVAQLEEIEKKITQVKDLAKDWEILLSVKERELRQSNETPDRIYVMRYLDRWGISRISKSIAYSRSQTYKILKKIDKTVEKMTQNETFYVVK